MRTKDFILLGAGYAAGRMSKKMQAGPIGAVKKRDIDRLKVLKDYKRSNDTRIVLVERKDGVINRTYYPVYFVYRDGKVSWLGQADTQKKGVEIWKETIKPYGDGKIVK